MCLGGIKQSTGFACKRRFLWQRLNLTNLQMMGLGTLQHVVMESRVAMQPAQLLALEPQVVPPPLHPRYHTP